MPYHRRHQKRHRNKSSPQTLSTPKKYRHSEADRDEIAELTDSESAADSTMNSTMGEHVLTNLDEVHTRTSEQGIDMSQSLIHNANIASQVNTQQQFMPDMPQFAGSAGPGMMDPNMIHSAASLNYPPPHQMPNFAQPHNFQQFPPQVPPYLRLSEEDVIRVARQLKTLLRDEINELVEERVALAVQPLKLEIATVKTSLVQVQSELKQATVRNDDLKQYSRRSCLRISGVQENENEDVSKIVLDIARQVGADISLQDIDRTHRVGKTRDQNTDIDENDMIPEQRVPHRGREIIIKFNNYSARLNLLKGRATLREQKANIYINEDLTKKRKDLAYECRRLKKAKCILKTWVYNGSIFLQDNSNKQIRVTSVEDLDAFRPVSNNGNVDQSAGH